MHANPRLLYLVHCYDSLAGVELHTRALVEGLQDRYQIAVAFPHKGQILVRRGSETIQTYPADPPSWPVTPYRSPRTEESIAQLLESVRPDLIHVQHFFNWPLSVIDRVAAFGVPVILSFHDFYAITPYYTMQGADKPEDTFTPAYSRKIFGKDLTPYLQERRRLLAASFLKVQARIAISPFLERQLAQIFPVEYRVIEYGIKPFTRAAAALPAAGLRFGYFGEPHPQKGWESLYQAFPAVVKRHPQAELHFFGGSPADDGLAAPGVTFHGPYQPDDLPRLTAMIDVAVIPSLFAETYCLVLSEVWQAGLPVAVADIGALAERVVDGVTGKKFRPGDRDAIAATLLWFLEHDGWRRWRLPQPRLLPAMLADYDRLYQEHLSEWRRLRSRL
jgi:glycosyltransferase involved in cell wall biosynthesis